MAAIEVIRQLSERLEAVAERQERESTARRQADDLTRSVLQRAVVQRLTDVRAEVNALTEELRKHTHDASGPQADLVVIVQELERTGDELRQVATAQRHMAEDQSAMGSRLEGLAIEPPGDWGLVERIAQAVQAQAEQVTAAAASLDETRAAIVQLGLSQEELVRTQVTFEPRLAELAENHPALVQHANVLAANQEAVNQRLAELAANQATLDQRLADRPVLSPVSGEQAALNQRVAELAANVPALVHHASELAANQTALHQQLAELVAGHAALSRRVAELAERIASPPQAPVSVSMPVVPTSPLAALEADLRDIEHRLAQRTVRPDT